MKSRLIAVFAGLILAANAAAFSIESNLAQSMDDVHSLGVVYINHNSADDSKADQLFNKVPSVENAL